MPSLFHTAATWNRCITQIAYKWKKKEQTKTTLIYNRRAYCIYRVNTLTLVDFFLALLRFPLFFSLLVAFWRPHCKQTSPCVERDSLLGGKSKGKQMAMQPRHPEPHFCLVHMQAQEPRGLRATSLQKAKRLCRGTRPTKKNRSDLRGEQQRGNGLWPAASRYFTISADRFHKLARQA